MRVRDCRNNHDPVFKTAVVVTQTGTTNHQLRIAVYDVDESGDKFQEDDLLGEAHCKLSEVREAQTTLALRRKGELIPDALLTVSPGAPVTLAAKAEAKAAASAAAPALARTQSTLQQKEVTLYFSAQ